MVAAGLQPGKEGERAVSKKIRFGARMKFQKRNVKDNVAYSNFENEEILKGPQAGPEWLGDEFKGPVWLGDGKKVY